MGSTTPLFDEHRALGAQFVDFAGYRMPLHYGSQVEEHHAVRRRGGVFDVSHMGIIDIAGTAAFDWLRRMLANDVAKLKDGGALYSCMLNEQGGVIDDLIVYRLDANQFRIVVNAANKARDLAWMRKHANPLKLRITERSDFAMLAAQGPQARETVAALLPVTKRRETLGLRPFSGMRNGAEFVSRTGYTGEDGFEIMLPREHASHWWKALIAGGMVPAGLGARDTLRLEAGLCLYGNDLDESHDPLASGLGWTVALEPAERNFIGRPAIDRVRGALNVRAVGLILDGRGIMRHGQRVATRAGDGVVTSGGFSPTLNRSIALARVPIQSGNEVEIDMRGQWMRARCVKPPFVRRGELPAHEIKEMT